MRSVSIAIALLVAAPLGCGAPYEDSVEIHALKALSGRLSWRTPVDTSLVPSAAGTPLVGHSLKEIVSGDAFVVDGKRCSQCHFTGSGKLYAPDVEEGGRFDAEPDLAIAGRAWGGEAGWYETFCTLDDPVHGAALAPLREAFDRWTLDGQRATAALTWTSPITAENIGADPDPRAAGATLHDAINNLVSPRPDGKYCAECHYPGGEVPYRPDPDAEIGPTSLVDGRTWAGPGGWAERFIALDENAHFTKPAYVRAVFVKWLADGGH